MPIQPLLLFLSPFLLLIIYTPFASSINCVPIPQEAAANHGSFTIGSRNFTVPVAADCLHIVSVLPSSLHLDPSEQRAHGSLTLNYRPFERHRFDMPALFKHRTCEIHITTHIRDHPDHHHGREYTRMENAFYFWNIFKSTARDIINTCMIGTESWCGFDGLLGSTMGFTVPVLEGSRAAILVGSVGYIIGPDFGINEYNV